MPKKVHQYYIYDKTRNANQIKQMRMFDVLSKIVVFHWYKSTDLMLKDADEYIARYWTWDKYPPSTWTFKEYCETSKILWYIKNHLQIERSIPWNTDFLQGLVKNGDLIPDIYPSFRWQGYFHIIDLLQDCPFSGKLSNKCETRQYKDYLYFKYVPAFLLSYSEKTPSFLAGILSGGKIIKVNGYNYLKYNKRVIPYFEYFGIPIEEKHHLGILISPIWAALFTLYMPEYSKKMYLGIKKAYKVDIYAPVLWRTYVSENDFISKGIPFLKSRRMVLYDHQCEEGAWKKLDKLRFTNNLNMLDKVIVDCIHEWKNLSKKSKEEPKCV